MRRDLVVEQKHLVQFVDDGGFADAGIAGDLQKLRRAAFDDSIESGEQAIHLARPAVQILGVQLPLWDMLCPQLERFSAPS